MAMGFARRIGCRAVQAVFRAAMPLLPYREPELLASIEDIAPVLSAQGVTSVLLVTGPTIHRLGLTRGLEESLARAGIACAVYDRTPADPMVSCIEETAAVYLENDCSAIIAFGGGSPMDCAKVAGARIAAPTKTIAQMRGTLRIRRPLPPLIAVPTTAGSGSEATLAAVVTDESAHHKYPINDFVLIPRYAVHDATLTCGLPPSATAQTGMDALTHAVEAAIGRSTTAYTRACAREAVRLIHDNLPQAFRDGDDMAARGNMLTASYKAGIAFTRSYVGYVHAIAHSLGGRYGTPHGLACAVCLPHVLRAYGAYAEKALAELARAAGIAGPSGANAQAAAAFIAWVDETNTALGIPSHLGCIREEDIAAMAARADAEANPLYPVPALWDAEDLAAVYRAIAA